MSKLLNSNECIKDAVVESKQELLGHHLILVGTLPPPPTGPSVAFEMLCRDLKKHGASCAIINLAKTNYSENLRTKILRSIDIIKVSFQYFWYLICGYRRVYINIAQSFHGFCRDALLIWLGRTFGARIVVHLRGGNYDNFYRDQVRFVRFLIRITLRRVERIIILGEGLRGMYLFDPSLVNRIHVVHNGLSIKAEGKAKVIDTRAHNMTRIVYLSNLIESKGYFDVLESVRILRDAYKLPISCIFAGLFLPSRDDVVAKDTQHAQKRFFDYINKYNLNHFATYVGEVYGSSKWELLRNSHFFVLPTRYINEGQPMSIIEAMAFGCVVISTNYRAIPDLVVNGTTGVFVDYGEPEQIASAIADLCANPERYNQMSKSAVKRYQRYFTMPAYLETITPHIIGE